MTTAPSPARARAATHACPGGCHRQVPQHLFACKPCWLRLPYDLRQPISANYRRDEAAHLAAMADARHWYRENPVTLTEPPPSSTLAEQLQDMANMLMGIGRHATHTRQQAGRCVTCSCGLRVQGQTNHER